MAQGVLSKERYVRFDIDWVKSVIKISAWVQLGIVLVVGCLLGVATLAQPTRALSKLAALITMQYFCIGRNTDCIDAPHDL